MEVSMEGVITVRLEQPNGAGVFTVNGIEERHVFLLYDGLTFKEIFLPTWELYQAVFAARGELHGWD